MKIFIVISLLFPLAGVTNLYSQEVKFNKEKLQAVNVSMSLEEMSGRETVRVIKDPGYNQSDGPTFVKLKGINFTNGTIEVKVLSKLLPNAPDYARGFIGVAFRINDSNSRFEGIYIRPTNGRTDDPVRRSHATQYFSYPGYDFDRLRKESPGVYESNADIGLNEWIELKIVIQGAVAKLFINNKKEPSLIVNDLKLGAGASGSIGLWVDIGTEGYFADLKTY